MERDLKIQKSNCRSLRYGMIVPLALMIATVVSCCVSFSSAKQNIADDLNEAMIALVSENSELWTRQDTVAALRQMHATIHKPLIYQASDAKFRNAVLKDVAYFTLALVDMKNNAPIISGDKIASDSIMLVPGLSGDGLAIQVQGFADCSLASLFAASDQTLPGVFFTLSILSTAGMFVWRRKEVKLSRIEHESISSKVSLLAGVKLTPMQRRFVEMLLDAPEMKVDKATLCRVLWNNKINAEESLYTLVRRTKTALAKADIEIVCNRGDSYELRVSD